MGRTDFSDQFRKIKIRHKRIGYDLNVMRQSACLVINPITVDNFTALFNCPDLKLFILVGWDRSFSSVAWSTGAQLMIFFCFRFSVVLFDRLGISICHAARCICYLFWCQSFGGSRLACVRTVFGSVFGGHLYGNSCLLG